MLFSFLVGVDGVSSIFVSLLPPYIAGSSFDGSGVNCGVIKSSTSNIYETQVIQDGRQFEYDEDVEKKVPVLVKKELWKLYGSTHKSKVKSLVILLLLKLGLKG